MLILLARKKDAEFALGDITNNNARIGLRQAETIKKSKRKLSVN